MPNRALTIALRLDTSDHDAGIQRSIEGERNYAREQARVNAEMKNAFDRLGETRARAMSGEGLMGRGLINWDDQKTRLTEFEAAQARVGRAVDAQDAAVSRQRVGRALGEYQVRVSLEERYYAATHTQQEVALNNLQNYYARLRAQHAGNAQVLAQIDRTYAAEAAALGGPLGTVGGRGVGERGLARVGRGVGAAVGASGVGGEAGSLLGMAAMPGMAPLAAAAAVGLAVGSVMQDHIQHERTMTDLQVAYNQQLRESSRWWNDIAARSNTALGRSAEQRAAELTDQAGDIRDKSMARVKEMSWLSKGWTAVKAGVFHGGDFGKTSEGEEVLAEKRLYDQKQQEAGRLRMIAAAERERQTGREGEDWKRRAAESGTGAMASGPARKRQELKDSQAREAEERKRRQADEDRADTLRNLSVNTDKMSPEELTKFSEDAAARKKALDAKFNTENAAAAEIAANQQKALDRDIGEEQIREANRTADLKAVAGKRGYAREEAALQEHYHQEIAVAERAGDTVKKAELEKQRGLAEQAQRDNRDEEARKEHVALSIREAQATGQYAEALKQARAEEARQAHEKYNDPALEKQHMDDYDKVQAAERAEGVRKTHVDNQIKLMEATGHYQTALNLARAEQERQYRALGYTDDQVQKLMADWDKLKQAQADHSGLEAIKSLNIELERQMGHITALEAERQRLRQANPLASQSVIDEQARKSEELRLRKQFESPAQKFQKFSGDVTAAMRPGPHGEPPIISKGRAEIEIRNELRSLMGQSGEGKMSDMSSRWSEIQNAVNEPAQLTADEQRAFWSELTALWKAGLKIRM